MTNVDTRLRDRQDVWRQSAAFEQGMKMIEIIEANARRFDVGAFTIVLEERLLNEEILSEHWESVGREDIPELDDGGLAIHLVDNSDGHEYLRFDCFRDYPHYHYLVPGIDGVTTLRFDPIANGDMAQWVLSLFRTRMVELLEGAGAFALAEQVDTERLAAVIADIERDLAVD